MTSSKTCSRCQEEKPKSCFGKGKGYKDGLRSICKSCRAVNAKNRRDRTKKKNSQEGPKKVCSKVCNKCKVEKPITAYHSDIGSPDGHVRTCATCIVEVGMKYREENPDYIKEYQEKNRDTLNKKRVLKKKKNEQFRLGCRVRQRMNDVLYDELRSGESVDELGVSSYKEFRSYVASKFYNHPETGEAMTWDNRGRDGWHLDHVRPLSSFDLTDPLQYAEAVHHANIQPLWSLDHRRKNSDDLPRKYA